jgi:hypothetical protein
MELLAMFTQTSRSCVALFSVLIGFSGCAAQTVVPEPGKISLEDALVSVGVGLVKMKQEQITEAAKAPLSAREFTTGLMPAQVQVTFNISANGTDAKKLYVEVTPVAAGGAPVGGKIGGEAGTTFTAARGNQVTVTFQSLLFSKTTTTGADKTVTIVEGPTPAESLDKILDLIINKYKMHPYSLQSVITPPLEQPR